MPKPTTLIAWTALTIAQAASPTALAEDRVPFKPRAARTTLLDLRPGEVQRIHKTKRSGESIRFDTKAVAIEEGAVVLFEIRTEGDEGRALRWRCIALENTAECFPRAVEVAWRPSEVQATLSILLEPRKTRLGAKLAEEAKARWAKTVASQ